MPILFKGKNDELTTNKADALTSLNVAATELDKFVLLSYAQNILIQKNVNQSKSKKTSINKSNENSIDPKKLFQVNPILLRSNLSNYHKYAVVLTSNFNINATCCDCDCHIKE